MSERPVPTTLMGSSLWRRLDEPVFELCRLRSTEHGFLIDGRVLAFLNNSPAEVHYMVHCGHDWITRQAHVTIFEPTSARQLIVRRDDEGRWFRMDWTERSSRDEPEETRLDGLDGVLDVDLALTPATNTLAIRRMALGIGESRDADAAWVRFPELVVERLPQRYTRAGQNSYRYESHAGAFVADLEVDDTGLIVRYGDLWERVTP